MSLSAWMDEKIDRHPMLREEVRQFMAPAFLWGFEWAIQELESVVSAYKDMPPKGSPEEIAALECAVGFLRDQMIDIPKEI